MQNFSQAIRADNQRIADCNVGQARDDVVGSVPTPKSDRF